MSPWSLSGKKALVTGGTKGIGEAIVNEFLELGADVIAVARNTSNATKHPRLQFVTGDVTQADFRRELLQKIANTWGKLDILVNNVGTNIRKQFADYSEEEYRKLFETNLFAMMAV